MTGPGEPRRHVIRWQLLALAVAAGAISAQRQTLAGALERLGALRPAWLAAAIAAEVASFVLAAEVLHQLSRSAGIRATRSFFVALTYAGAAISRAVPAGGAVSVGYAYRRLVRRGVSARRATWVLIASGVVSVSTLASVGVIGAQLRGVAVAASTQGALVAVAVATLVSAAIAALARASRRRPVLAWLADQVSKLADFTRRMLGRQSRQTPCNTVEDQISVGLASWLHAGALSAGNWLADVSAIGLTFVALGLRLPWSSLLWAYVVIQLLESIPLLGCVGVAETSMTIALVCIGVRPAAALAVVLVYRLLNFWLTLPLGWLAARHLARAESVMADRPRRVRAATAATARAR